MDSSPLTSMSQAVPTARARLPVPGAVRRGRAAPAATLVGAHRCERQVAVVEQVEVGRRQVEQVRRGAGGLDPYVADPLEPVRARV